MKTKAILATLLVAATASADARFAPPFPRKAVSPDEIGHWVVINNAWPDSAQSELTTASRSGGGPDGLKSWPARENAPRRGTVSLMPHSRHPERKFQRIPTPFVLNETQATDSKLLALASLG